MLSGRSFSVCVFMDRVPHIGWSCSGDTERAHQQTSLNEIIKSQQRFTRGNVQLPLAAVLARRAQWGESSSSGSCSPLCSPVACISCVCTDWAPSSRKGPFHDLIQPGWWYLKTISSCGCLPFLSQRWEGEAVYWTLELEYRTRR